MAPLFPIFVSRPLTSHHIPAPSPPPAPPLPSFNSSPSFSNSSALIPRILSYNVNSLSYYASNSYARKRHSLISSFLHDSIKTQDIICLQETSLAQAEQHALSNLPGCIVSHNNLQMGTAGTLIIDTPSVLRHYNPTPISLPSCCKGRVQARLYTNRENSHAPFIVVNCYFVSGGDFTTNAKLIASLRALPSYPTFLCGDFNFIERAEDSSNPLPLLPPQLFLDSWHSLLDHLQVAELPSDAHTYYHIAEDPLSQHSRSSRLDRIFVPISLLINPSIHPSLFSPHHSSNFSITHRNQPSLRSFSDHLPIAILYSDCKARKRKTKNIPRWIADSPSFSAFVEKLWTPSSRRCPFRDLLKFKAVLFKASHLASLFHTHPSTSNLLLSQHLALSNLLHSLPQDGPRIAKLINLNPSLGDLVTKREGHWISVGLSEATQELLMDKTPTPSRAPNLLRDMALALPSNRKTIPSLRAEPEDPPIFDAAGKSKVAKTFWSKTWSARTSPSSRSERDSYLRSFNKLIDLSLCPCPTVVDVERAINKSNDSAPGPDGVPFAAWRAVAPLAAPLLYSALQAMLRGQLPPPGFNLGTLFLIPKKLTGVISDTRPISVTNTDNRILASVMASAIMPAVSAFVCPAQRGFLAGKSGDSHVVNINKLFYDSIRNKTSNLLFLLDTAKAFDSVDHTWIEAVLAKAAFPSWFRNFVKGSLSDVKVAPFFGEDPTDWIAIERGVKQGCPLSPLLFLVAYDPLLEALARNPATHLFAFADDIAIFTDSVSSITPSLLEISKFSILSGLGINKNKSVVIPTGDPSTWDSTQAQLCHCPWPDLTIQASGTHLGIIIGRDVTLDDLWRAPITKAKERIRQCAPLVKCMSVRHRVTFANCFIASLFSYVSLFFVLPTELWKIIKNLVAKAIIPFNGGAFTYDTLLCGHKIYHLKPALRDVWAANVSLLAVRSSYFNPDLNYHDLPAIDLRFNMHISDHRDAAAVDLWRGRHRPDGSLIAITPPTSPATYKIFVDDVFLDKVSTTLGSKISSFLFSHPSPLYPAPFPDPTSITSSIASALSIPLPPFLSFFHLSLTNNALASSRRTRHQFGIDIGDVAACHYCGVQQDSVAHLLSECPIILRARCSFLISLGFPPSSFYAPDHPPLAFSFLITAPTPMVKALMVFNFAVWKFRLPALASRLERSEEWLINRLLETARSLLNSCQSPKAEKRPRTMDHFAEVALHNSFVLKSHEDCAICYTDGSASPNPGPSGAGAVFFVPSRDRFYDLGTSLGIGTNNAAELHAMGAALSFIPYLISTLDIKHFIIFSDSKFALNAVASKYQPLVYRDTVLRLRKVFNEVNKVCSVHIQWVRGHSYIGGNERADRIAKRYAAVLPASHSNVTDFNYSFHSHSFSFFCPITDLPLSFFLSRLPEVLPTSPGPRLLDVLDHKHDS